MGILILKCCSLYLLICGFLKNFSCKVKTLKYHRPNAKVSEKIKTLFRCFKKVKYFSPIHLQQNPSFCEPAGLQAKNPYQSPQVGNITYYHSGKLWNSLSNSLSCLGKTNGKQEYSTFSRVPPAPSKGKPQEEMQKCPRSAGRLPSELRYKLAGFVRPTGFVQLIA